MQEFLFDLALQVIWDVVLEVLTASIDACIFGALGRFKPKRSSQPDGTE